MKGEFLESLEVEIENALREVSCADVLSLNFEPATKGLLNLVKTWDIVKDNIKTNEEVGGTDITEEVQKEVNEVYESFTDAVEHPEPVVEEPVVEEPATEIKVSKADLREVLSRCSLAGKQEGIKELLSSFGAGKLSELKEEDYASAFAKASELLAEGDN